MSLKIRRVVTGHDASGKAVVAIDEISKNVISRRPNHESCVIWSTGEFPADNDGDADDGAAQGRHHRSRTARCSGWSSTGPASRRATTAPSSVDYAIVLSGEIDMEMDGTMVHLKHRRRAGAARHHPQLGQPRHRAVRRRLRAGRGQAGRARRQAVDGGRTAGSSGGRTHGSASFVLALLCDSRPLAARRAGAVTRHRLGRRAPCASWCPRRPPAAPTSSRA